MKPVLAKGLDYSVGTLAGATIRNATAGYSFVIRYVDAPANVGRKHIRPAEYADLLRAGVDVWLVFEVGTDDALGGYPAGVANAKRALAGAQWIGYPAGRPIFMASDRHLTAAQVPVALSYIDGATSVLGHGGTGVYGFWELIDACIATGRGVAYWQCGIAPAATDPVHVWQRNDGFVSIAGIQCDVNNLLIPIPVGGAAVQEPQTQWDYLYQRLCGSQKPWAGGITNTDDVANAELYDSLQILMRNNVEIHQVLLMVRQMQADIASLKAKWAP